MNFILKRDPVWLASLPSHNASPSLLLLGGDGQQVAVPAPLLLAVSPLVRSILTDLLPPAYSPCFLSLPAVTEDILHVMVDILATGSAGGEHMDKIEDVRQVCGMLGVEVSLVSCQVDSRQAKPEFDRSFTVEDSSEAGIDFPLDEKNIKLEVIVKTEDKNADDEKSRATRKGFYQQILAKKCPKIPCNFCPQEFTLKRNLMRHIKSAHDQIRMSCKLCPQKFTQKSSLVIHIKSVHDQIKFNCQLCPQKFSQKQGLVRHIKSVHERIKFPCNLCSQKFTQKRNLVKHVKSVHDQPK